MSRLLPLVLFVSCGVFGLSEQDRRQLALFQSNAQTYWQGNDIDQALDQVRRGLAIDPEDYKLRTIQAYCVLRQSGGDPVRVARAAALFDRVLALRSDSQQGPQARLGYAEAHGRIGLHNLERAREIRDELSRVNLETAVRAEREAEAAAFEATGAAEFDLAEYQMTRLVELGDNLRLAHYNLMSAKWWRGDYDSAVKHGQKYLERAHEMQDRLRRDLDQTLVVDYERQVRIELQTLLDEEINVRGFLANMHYKKGHHELVVKQLDAILLVDPNRFNEYYNRGRSLLALGRGDDARRDLQKFLATTDLPRDSVQVRDALRSLSDLQ